MIRAAICDDETAVLDHLYEHISKEFKQQGADIQIDKFTFGNDFLNSHKTEPFDVVFLDIDMPEISGFDIAEEVNAAEEALIVFVTSHDDMVYSSIKFRPFRFIRKTYLENELPETIISVIGEISKRRSGKKYAFQTKSGETYIDLNSVEYIEIYGHNILVHVKDSEPPECHGSLSALETELESYDFVRVHKSFLVNCKYIYSIERNLIVLDNGTEIPLSRYKAEAVKIKYKKYLRRTL